MNADKLTGFAKFRYLAHEDALNKMLADNIPHQTAIDILEGGNDSYLGEHKRINPTALANWETAQSLLVNFFAESSEDVPTKVGDRVVVTATGRTDKETRLYENAIITEIWDGDATICVQPHAPFINTNPTRFCNNNGILMSVSGGYFQSVPLDELKQAPSQIGTYCFWGTTAQASGALYMKVMARTWSVTSDKFY